VGCFTYQDHHRVLGLADGIRMEMRHSGAQTVEGMLRAVSRLGDRCLFLQVGD
jgi:hypothetical protein